MQRARQGYAEAFNPRKVNTMQWQDWYPLGIFTVFVLGYALVALILRRNDRRDWRTLQSDSGQETSPIAIAECIVAKLLRAEFEIALGDMIVGPPEFERGARERIKLAVERSRTALKYVDELQRQAGNAVHDQEGAPRYVSVFRF